MLVHASTTIVLFWLNVDIIISEGWKRNVISSISKVRVWVMALKVTIHHGSLRVMLVSKLVCLNMLIFFLCRLGRHVVTPTVSKVTRWHDPEVTRATKVIH